MLQRLYKLDPRSIQVAQIGTFLWSYCGRVTEMSCENPPIRPGGHVPPRMHTLRIEHTGTKILLRRKKMLIPVRNLLGILSRSLDQSIFMDVFMIGVK